MDDRKYTKEGILTYYKEKFPELDDCMPEVLRAVDAIIACYRNNGRVFTCGNGGSSSDSAHIVGEFLKGFLLRRPLPEDKKQKLRTYGELGELMADKMQGSLAAVDLSAQQAIITAVANDNDPKLIFAQQLWGLGRPGDVLIGMSTSGNSKNVLCAGIAAKELGVISVALTGRSGGAMKDVFDICIRVPSDWTPGIQEYHLPIYHLICSLVEIELFSQFE